MIFVVECRLHSLKESHTSPWKFVAHALYIHQKNSEELYRCYQKLPQIKKLYKDLIKEFGIFGFIKIYWKLGGIKRKVVFRALKMKKKWPFKVPEDYLSKKISHLREIHGIKVLLPEEMQYAPVTRIEVNS